MKLPNTETEFHFMVDLETLSLASDASITEIGACACFPDERYDRHMVTTGFHRDVYDADGHMDSTTINWRKAHNLPWKDPEDCKTLRDSLVDFHDWLDAYRNGRTLIFWCKGTDFDLSILRSAYGRVGFIHPWKYNNVRDMRTLLALFPEFKIPEELKPHKGLADAENQAHQLRLIMDCLHGMESNQVLP